MILKEFENKKILILGLGKEGIDSYKFFRKIFPKKILGLADQLEHEKLGKELKKIIRNDKKIRFHLGKNYLKALKNYDIIIKSPGIPIHLPEIERAFKQGKITSQTEIFFDNWPPNFRKAKVKVEMKANSKGGKLHRPGKIIGITGTKGKGTVSSLIYQILKKGGKKVHLVGNIGRPPLSLLLKAKNQDIFVYELSSHQLLNLKRSPGIAVLLNIAPAHLDYFKNLKEYVRAKENIAIYQKKDDIFIYPKYLSPIVEKVAQKTKAKKISFSIKNKDVNCYTKKGYIFYKNEKTFKIKDSPLKGDFNLLNIMPAIIVGRLYNIPPQKIANVIRNFQTLPHRLEFAGTWAGIKFYNDSLATIPEATIAAIRTFGKTLETIILGGFDSGLDYKNLAKEILKSGIKNLILFPPIGEKIWKEILWQTKNKPESRGVVNYFFVDNMREAIKLSFKHTGKEKVCLLSPAAPSFGIFRDYKERGDLFKKYVKIYARCHNLNGSRQKIKIKATTNQ